MDVYGGCGGRACDNDCYRNLPKTYKFYLSFENNYCDEYITEKFFRMLKNRVVPIVLGECVYFQLHALNYSDVILFSGGGDYTKIAPDHSYINVEDFSSAKELAEYIEYLDNNETEYLSYFWWESHYDIDAVSQILEYPENKAMNPYLLGRLFNNWAV